MIPINKQARAILSGLVETFDAIDKVNSLEQHEATLNARIAALTAAKTAAEAELGEKERAIAAAQRFAIEVADQARADAETIKAKAHNEATQMREAAESAAARAKAKENASEAAERKAKKDLAEIEAKKADAAKTLAEIEAKIEAAKAAARTVFGG